MAYIDKAYVLTMIKEAELNNLIKDDAGIPQDSYLTEKINAADNTINGYLVKSVKTLPIPAVSVPDNVKLWSFSLALFYLHVRNQPNNIPDFVKDLYDAAINALKDIAEGNATLFGVATEEEKSSIKWTAAPNILTRESF